MKRTPLRRVSHRRSLLLQEYIVKRQAYLLAHPVCQICLDKQSIKEADVLAMISQWEPGWHYNFQALYAAKLSTDIHHKKGRIGLMLLDETHWMAACRGCHRWIHDHPKDARAKGWLE